MLKVMLSVLVLASAGLAQSSSDGTFSVHHAKKPDFSLSSDQMREAESLYHGACDVVQRDFNDRAGKLEPHFTVVVGAERNEVVGNTLQTKRVQNNEIRMKKWDPVIFVQGVVVLAFDQMLTDDEIKQLTVRAVRSSKATVDVAGLK